MKIKIIIIAVCIMVIGAGTAFGILNAGKGSIAAELPVETSVEIGAHFYPGVQIEYVSFAPVISRSEAIAVAREWFATGFRIPADNFPAEATVALYSGPASTEFTGEVVRDVQAWIVVLKDVPGIETGGPPPMPGQPKRVYRFEHQADVAIDAITGKVIYGERIGKRILVE